MTKIVGKKTLEKNCREKKLFRKKLLKKVVEKKSETFFFRFGHTFPWLKISFFLSK